MQLSELFVYIWRVKNQYIMKENLTIPEVQGIGGIIKKDLVSIYIKLQTWIMPKLTKSLKLVLIALFVVLSSCQKDEPLKPEHKQNFDKLKKM